MNSMNFKALWIKFEKFTIVITFQKFERHNYAPMQAYLHCPFTAAMGAARAVPRAMGALADWMSSNRLPLNAQKTKFIWVGTRQQLAKLNLDALSAEFPTMSFSQVGAI